MSLSLSPSLSLSLSPSLPPSAEKDPGSVGYRICFQLVMRSRGIDAALLFECSIFGGCGYDAFPFVLGQRQMTLSMSSFHRVTAEYRRESADPHKEQTTNPPQLVKQQEQATCPRPQVESVFCGDVFSVKLHSGTFNHEGKQATGHCRPGFQSMTLTGCCAARQFCQMNVLWASMDRLEP